MKINKNIGLTMVAAGMLCAASCSDFSDYNEVKSDAVASGNQTLWENIQQNPQLTNFAALVSKAGFADALNAPHYYTVWAPLDGTYDASAYQQMGSDAVLRQFVYNHVADYGHSATGSVEERVLMLNKKKHDFEGQGSYTFDGISLASGQFNLPSSNGMLHLIDGAAVYYPNLYDFITDSLLSVGKDIDSLRHYFQHYEHIYLDEDASVVGPIVDGMQTYIDSVMVVQNDLTDQLRTKFDNEDSTYTFIMPTNTAWSKAYDHIKSYYNFAPVTSAEAYVTANGQTTIATDPVTWEIDNVYVQDSLTKRQLTRNLVYSNTDFYNQWLTGPASYLGADTLRTTTRTKLSNPGAILGQAVDQVEMSNGQAIIVDSLAMASWETFAPQLSAGAVENRARLATANSHTYVVQLEGNPDLDRYTYLWAESTSDYSKAGLDIYLPNVLSTTYDIYCVFSPAFDQADNENFVALPNRVNFELSYCDADGTVKKQTFLDESEENVKWCTDYIAHIRATNPSATATFVDNVTTRTTFRGFSNDPSRLDSVYVGRFTFPVSYAGLGSNSDHICPNIKITSPFSVFNRTVTAAFSRDLRVAAIVLKPIELVEFEESNKQ